ncbi:MAG: sugar ABC transporter ATP-binding protein [Anaerolineaceae bacterium]|nr:sugar ABC transporter ATP-binding protein [Anaerolineaceae bacterium]
MKSIVLYTEQIEKRFGGVIALKDGSIEVRSGEVLALVGSNGSGKSTLTKVITGVLSSDGGTIIYHDDPVTYTNPMAAQKAGIMAVYQELSLIPSLTVAQNIWLANEPRTKFGSIDDNTMNEETAKLLTLFEGTYQSSLHPEAYVRDLPPDERQIVEILKAYSRKPDVLILDEATASLDSKQVSCLFDLVQLLKSENKGLVFVSHRMDEIFRIADRAVVLRNGKTVGEVVISESNEDEIVNLMVGGNIGLSREFISQMDFSDKDTILMVNEIENDRLSGVSFDIKQGELVGIGGLRGQGQSSLLHTLFGNNHYTGTITLFDEILDFDHPKEAMDNGIALIPGDRATEGLLLLRSIFENLHLPNWAKYSKPLLKVKRAYSDAEEVSEQLKLVMESLDSPVSNLSGGNAQKVVIGKWLLRSPKLLLLDDPTKGVDVGTKSEFYKLLVNLQQNGTTILFYSSDEQELLDLCERVLVMQDGKIKADLSGDKLTEANLVFHSMGATNNNNHKEESTHA